MHVTSRHSNHASLLYFKYLRDLYLLVWILMRAHDLLCCLSYTSCPFLELLCQNLELIMIEHSRLNPFHIYRRVDLV
jgi:hypothetical protein